MTICEHKNRKKVVQYKEKFMDDNRQILPCPFCGGEAILKENEYDDYYIKRYYTVHCIECSGSVGNTNSCLTKEEAIEAWNKRAGGRMTTFEEIRDEVAGMLADGKPLEDVISKLEKHKSEMENLKLMTQYTERNDSK